MTVFFYLVKIKPFYLEVFKLEQLLQMTGISKTFPGVKALSDVSFGVCKGEVMGLMGENGAGKSTLIKIITGFYSRDNDKGEMIFDGKNINPSSVKDAQALGISPIYQELNLSPFLSIAENIYLGQEPRKHGLIDWKAMKINAKKVLADLGINDVNVNQPMHTQSTAIQQMTSIARALVMKAKLLIMDEATSSLENKEVDILFGVVRKLKENGISIIFITHKLEEVFSICDRATILKDGEFISCLPIKELSKNKLISLMIGRDATDIINKKKEYTFAKDNSSVFISAKNITKPDYRLNGLNTEIYKGEILGLAGLLGSGRTEFAKVIFGDDQNYEGEIYLNSMAIRFKSPADAVKSKFAFCSEDRKAEGIFPYMSVRDNLTMSIMSRISVKGLLNRREMQSVSQEYVKATSIKTPDINTKIKDLSGGNQQKVILSRWLATKPDLIILDEPTRGIDVGAKSEIEDLIKKISDEGISVIYISSELDELVRGCDRVVILSLGRKIKELVADEISRENIIDAFAIEEKDIHEIMEVNGL